MAGLESTAESFLGIPGISRVAASATPVGSGLGSFSGAVSPVQRAFLDKNLLDQTVDILDKANRVRTFLDMQRARNAGQQVLGDLSNLDPSQPDYLQRRNEIMARNPSATLDDTAMRFLGLQEDVYNLFQGDRQREEEFDRQQKFYEQREDSSLRKQEDYDRRVRDREIDREVRGLGPGAQMYFRDAIQRKKDPLSKEDAFAKAQAYEEDRAIRNQLLESGIPEEAFGELEITGPDGLRIIDTDKAQPILSSLLQRKAYIADVEAEIKSLEGTIRELRRDLSAFTTGTDEFNAIRQEIDTLQQQVAAYKGQISRVRNPMQDGDSSGNNPKNPAPGAKPVAPNPITG